MEVAGTSAMRKPWGVRRMRPYPTVERQPFVHVSIDPATQLALYYDACGRTVEMGRHGTSKGTETHSESTNMDSRNDTDHDQDSEQDPGTG